MGQLKLTTKPEFDRVIENYPDGVRVKMSRLRELVRETAEETAGLSHLEESLKWGEPSFITKDGSTLRMNWKNGLPDQYAMYFQCSSRLVDTFRLVYGNKFRYEGNRAIIFQMAESIPIHELKECIKTTLMYHKIKHLKTLGI